MEITQEHIDLTMNLGACRVKYQVGTPISEVSSNDLRWFAEVAPKVAASIASTLSSGVPGLYGCLPLHFFGYSDGHGYGDGYGDYSGQ